MVDENARTGVALGAAQGPALRSGPTRLALWGACTGLLAIAVTSLSPNDGLFAGLGLVALALAMAIRTAEPGEAGPVLLFALTLTVFAWARPVLAALSPQFDLDVIETLGGIGVTKAGQVVYLRAMACSMVAFATTVVFLEATPRPPRVEAPERAAALRGPHRFWGWCFWLGAVATGLQALLYARYYAQGGSYVELYLLGKEAVTLPGLSLVSSLLFYGYVGLISFAEAPEGTRRRWALLFALFTIATLARGSRGEVFAQLLVGAWLYFFSVGKRPRLAFWAVMLALLVIVAEGVSIVRAGIGAEDRDSGVVEGLGWALYTQGLSGELVGAAHDHFGVGVENLRFVFSPLLGPVRQLFDPSAGTQTDAYGQSSGLLAHELSYRANPDLYLTGHGTGSSYLAEVNAGLGLPGVVVVTAALVWCLGYVPRLARASGRARFLLACALPYVLFVPRESLLLFVVPLLKAALVLWIYDRYETSRHRRGPDVQPGVAS